MAVSFRILGPLEVQDDGTELPLGTGRQRALLALLLVHANELVSSGRLIEELWSGRPPASAQKALQGYVSQLRRALSADSILTRGSGYLLVATDTDAKEFERLTRLAAEQDADEAILTLERALALWRGRALEEFEYEEWAQLEIARLEELRLAATEQRIEAELELGHHAELVPELEKRVAEHPLREQLRGQLMVALYRSGRHAEALEVYRRGRQVLRDELGLEPSPFLAELERQILSHDDTLRAPARRRLPVGTVTFLFTDIEGSTRLLKRLGERYGDVLEQHQRILRDAAERCEGREVDNQGDSFFFAFARAKSAVAAAVIAQRALARHQWPGGVQVRVRMGLHTDEPAVGKERYVGLGVHRAARIGAAGHGGQVLLSNATRELVEDAVGDVSVRSLGSYRLKDVDRPEPLFQLDIDGLATEFPPLKAERVRKPRPPRRRLLLAGVVASAIVGIAVATIVFAIVGGPTHKVLPNSLVRIDPKTLKATQVAQVGDAPDLVIASGGYLWVTNNILRDSSCERHQKRGRSHADPRRPVDGRSSRRRWRARTVRVDRRSLRRRLGGQLLPAEDRSPRHRGANRREHAQLQGDLACPRRSGVLPGACLRRWLALGLRWRQRTQEHDHADRSANGCAADHTPRALRRRTCMVGRVRRPMDGELRQRKPHATVRGNGSHRDGGQRCDQSRLARSRR